MDNLQQARPNLRSLAIVLSLATLAALTIWTLMPKPPALEALTRLQVQQLTPQPKFVERLSAEQLKRIPVVMTREPLRPPQVLVDEQGKVLGPLPAQNPVRAEPVEAPASDTAYQEAQAELEAQRAEGMARLYTGEDASGFGPSIGALDPGALPVSEPNYAVESGLEAIRAAALSLAKAGIPATERLQALAAAKQSLEALHAELDQAFAADRQLIERSQAPSLAPRIDTEQRLQHARIDALQQTIERALLEVQAHPNAIAAQQQAAEVLAQQLEVLNAQTPAPIFGANPLPVSRPSFAVRPLPTGTAIVPSYAAELTEAAAPADLQDGSLASLEPEIIAKAAELQYNYVALFDFVRTQIRSQAYAGAMKSAGMVLKTKAGNAEDQASLLIALLRAAKTPARYVHGVVSISRSRLAATLSVHPDHLDRALTLAGIAFAPDGADAVKIEHTWVSALVPYALYRGSFAATGDAVWLPLDSYLKPHTVTLSRKPLSLAGLTGAGYVASWIAGNQTDYPANDLDRALSTALSALSPAQTLSSATGAALLNVDPLDLLPNALPAKATSVLWEQAELPETLVQRAQITLLDPSNANPVLDITLPIAKLAQQRTYLSFVGATPEDANLLLANSGLARTPPYLLKLRPVLKNHLGNLASGTQSADAGIALKLRITLQSPAGNISLEQQLISGVAAGVVFALPGDRATSTVLLTDTVPGNNAQEESDKLGRLLWNLGQGYVQQWDLGELKFNNWLDISPITPLPQVVLVLNQMTPDVQQGRIAGLTWRGAAIDALLRVAEPVSRTAERTQEADWLQLSALHGSYGERALFKSQWNVDAVSAEFGFKLARAANPANPLRTLNPGASLTGLQHAPEVLGQIQIALDAGRTVQIPERVISQQTWSGSTWREVNPTTGESGYFLSGRYAGGVTSTPPNLWYFTEAVSALIGNGAPVGSVTYAEALSIYPPSQGQIGIVGETLALPLEIVALDRYGRAVPNVQVKLLMLQGVGKFEANSQGSITVATDGTGRARAKFILGTDFRGQFFSELPGTPNPIRAGVVTIDASAQVNTDRGLTILRSGEPFRAYAKPGLPVKLEHDLDIHLARIQNGPVVPTTRRDPLVRSYPFRGVFRVLDQYNNPVSNIPITIRVPHAAEAGQTGTFSYNGGLFKHLLPRGAAPTPGSCPAQTLALDGSAGGTNCLMPEIIVDSLADYTEFYYIAPGSGVTPYVETSNTPSIELRGVNQTAEILIARTPKNLDLLMPPLEVVGINWVETANGPQMGSLGVESREYNGGVLNTTDGNPKHYFYDLSNYVSIESMLKGSSVVLTKRLDHVEKGTVHPDDFDFSGLSPIAPYLGHTLLGGYQRPYAQIRALPYELVPGTGFSNSTVPVWPNLLSMSEAGTELRPGAHLFEAVRQARFSFRTEQEGVLSADVYANYRNSETPLIETKHRMRLDGAAVIAPGIMVQPSFVRLDNFGHLADTLNVSINESTVANVGRSEMVLYANGQAVYTAQVGGGILRSFQFSIPRGFVMDPDRTYSLGLRINVGTALEQSLEAKPLNILSDVILGFGLFPGNDVPLSLVNYANANIVIEDEINVGEGEVCKSEQVFAVHLGQASLLDLKLQRINAFGMLSNTLTLFSNQAAPAGVNKFTLSDYNIPDGNYRLTLDVRSVANSSRTQQIMGTLVRRTKRTDLRSLSHTEVQGVDLFHGGYSASETDMPSFGRGPELSLRRSYFSHGGDNVNAFGRGWSSSLEQRIQADSCNRVRVQGSGGQGQVFVATTQTDAQGWLRFRPLHGYHGTLREKAGTYEYYALDGSRYVYSEAKPGGPGISFIEDTNGNRSTATYTLLGGERRMTRWASSNGRAINLTYSQMVISTDTGIYGGIESAWLVTLVNGDGIFVDYTYDVFGNLKTAKQRDSGAKTGFQRAYEVKNFGSVNLGDDGSIRLGFRLLKITDSTRNISQKINYFNATSVLNNRIVSEMRVANLEQPDAGKWTYTYEGIRGQTLSLTTVVKNPRNINTRYELNSYGATARQVDPIGSTTTLWSTEHRKPSKITDRLGRVREFGYDVNGNVTSETFAGLTTTTTYKPEDQFTALYIKDHIASQTNPGGKVTTYGYDVKGNATSSSLGGITTSMSYMANGDVNTKTDGKGGVWQYTYKPNGQPASQKDPLNRTQIFNYDNQGFKQSHTDEASATSQWTYDLQGRVLTERDPAAGVITTTYKDTEHRWEVKNKRGFITTYETDPMGRVIQVLLPDNLKEIIHYDAMGNKVDWTDRKSQLSLATYDALNRELTRTTGPRKVARELDEEGRVLSETVSGSEVVMGGTTAAPRTTTYVYDDTNYGWREQTQSGLVTIKRTFDANGLVVSETDPLNRVTTQTFDDRKRLVKRTEPEAYVIDYVYDANDQVIEEKRSGGWKRTYTRDAMNRVLTETDSDGKSTSSTYDERGLVKTRTDRRGGLTTNTYDSLRRLSYQAAPEARNLSFTYDPQGNVQTETRPNNQYITRVYDAFDRATRESDSTGLLKATTYDALGQVLSESRDSSAIAASNEPTTISYQLDRLGRQTSITQSGRTPISQSFNVFDEVSERDDGKTKVVYGYDALGRKISETVSDVVGTAPAETQAFTYDLAGNLKTQTDAMGALTTFNYDLRNRPLEQLDPAPLNTKLQWSYDVQGNVLSSTDRRGLVTTFTYDTENRQLTSTRNAILVETLTYDGEGAVLTRTDARTNKTELVHDLAGRKLKALLAPITAGDAAANALWTYNKADQIATRTEATSGVKWTYNYDTRQRKFQEIDGLNRSTGFTYNLRNELITKTPPKANSTSYRYDSAGALIELKDGIGKITSYQYDGQGNRTVMVNANLRTTTWNYGRSNRLTKQTWPADTGQGASRTWVYDLNGNVASETTENGAVITYGYDKLNRRVSMTTAGTAPLPTEVVNTAYTLDANGNITDITETTAGAVVKVESRTYDLEGRVKTVTDRNGKVRSYSYDAANNRIEEKDHDNLVVTHTYDARNRLASTTTPELGTTTYTYDGGDRLKVSSYANLAVETRMYDLAGQFTSLKHERAGGTLHLETYLYDANGNRYQLTQNDGTTNRVTTYTYDLADRLLSEINPEERLEDTLDAVGNRTQRLIKHGITAALQKTVSYTLNARDQVTQVQEKNAANVITKTETYIFDADGSRISKTDGGTTTLFKYDRRGRQFVAGSVLYELNDSDVRTAKIDGTRTEYVMEGLKLEAEVVGGTTTARYRWGMQLIGEARGGVAKTILQDRFRSPLILLDQAGGISDRVRYTGAGEIRQRTGTSPLAFGYGGYLTQSGTDELYAFARTYSPGLGRFNENDPVRGFDPMLGMGPHRYVLGYGNPLVYTDPDGRCAEPVTGVMCLAAAVGVIGWAGSAIYDEVTTGASFDEALLNPKNVLNGAAAGGIVLSGGTLGPSATALGVMMGTGADVAVQMNLEDKAYFQVDYGRSVKVGSAMSGLGAAVNLGVASTTYGVATTTRIVAGGAAGWGAADGAHVAGEGLAEGKPGKVMLGLSLVSGSAAGGLWLRSSGLSGNAAQLDAALENFQPKVGVVVESRNGPQEKFSENTRTYASYEEYLLANSPEAKIANLIEKYGLQKHLSGIEVKYAGARSGKLGGVHPEDPKVIKIYEEGLSSTDREFVELIIEETHHSKTMGLFPQTRANSFNETWNTTVEPRAKAYARSYADRILGVEE